MKDHAGDEEGNQQYHEIEQQYQKIERGTEEIEEINPGHQGDFVDDWKKKCIREDEVFHSETGIFFYRDNT